MALRDLLQQQALQLLPAIIDTLSIRGINHPYECVGLFEVILPVRPQGLLTSDIPC